MLDAAKTSVPLRVLPALLLAACTSTEAPRTAPAATTAPAPSAAPAAFAARPLHAPASRATSSVRQLSGRRAFHSALEPLDLRSPPLPYRAPKPMAPLPAGARAGRRDADTSVVATLLNPIVGARFVRGERGARYQQALAALPPERRAYGFEGFTQLQLLGPEGDGVGGACERAQIDLTVTHQGQTYDARYEADFFVWTEALEPLLYALTATCTTALSRAGTDPARAVGDGCAREDEAAHFPAGSRCRTCLSADGDHARCVAAGQCRAEMTREVFVMEGRTEQSYDVLQASTLACAPDVTFTTTVLARELGEDNVPPAAFDHQAIARWCYSHWSPAAQAPVLGCYVSATDGGVRLAFADVLMGYIDFMRRPGVTTKPLYDRLIMSPRAEVEGFVFENLPLYPMTMGPLSEDNEHDGWGLPPHALRPDGRDPARVDDTFARDWLAAMSLKTATNIDGVPIYTYNRNLCTAADWTVPDASGRAFCKVPPYADEFQPPDDELWRYDWGAYLMYRDPVTVEVTPLLTLAATGLPDPSVPGGHAMHILGSTTLTDPEWENCRWPETFVPDEMANYDTPEFFGHTFVSQTYRFGRDPAVPVRMVLATNWKRAYCFEHLTP